MRNPIKHFAIYTAKLAKLTSTVLNIGSGSTIPGKVAAAIYPKILNGFYKKIARNEAPERIKIALTGTNGKTTTTGLIKSILHRPLICNNLGANLESGITTAFIDNTNIFNSFKTYDYLLEVDEATLRNVTNVLNPKIVTVTNLYRDQLDRFGELDTTQKLINEGIANIKDPPLLVLNADDPFVNQLGFEDNARIYYSVKLSDDLIEEEKQHAIEAAEEGLVVNLEKSFASSSSDIKADVRATVLEHGFDHSLIDIECSKGHIQIQVNLPGIYNVYNAAAAAATAFAAGLSLEDIKEGIESYKTNFGRAEEKTVKGVGIQTFLIKNPAGATEVLKHLAHDPNAKFLIAINDNYADGRDVSWLWDADFELLKNTKTTITVSGDRANDIALRLKYAGIPPKQIKLLPDIQEALDFSIDLCNYKNIKRTINASIKDKGVERKKIYILPTYTALLSLEKIY